MEKPEGNGSINLFLNCFDVHNILSLKYNRNIADEQEKMVPFDEILSMPKGLFTLKRQHQYERLNLLS